MKTKFTLLLFSLFLTYSAFADLEPGAIAPDWTLDQMPDNCDFTNGWGPEWNLYDELDAGLHVVIDFSAVWCSPCWSYHTGGTLDNMWSNYGPDGDGTIDVFYIETSCGNNDPDCLCGPTNCSATTQGDWMGAATFPFFNPSGSDCNDINNDYAIEAFPTLYVINAEYKTAWKMPVQPSQAVLESWLFTSFELAAEFEITDDLCGKGEGAIDLTTTGGQGTLSFLWNTGEETEDLDGLVAGDYSVTITDGNGYFIVKNVIVDGGNDPIEIEEDGVEHNLCYDAYEGSIEISVSGGDSDYDFLWSNGETTEDIYGLAGGTYTVVVTDGVGCTENMTFVVDEPDELFLYVTVTDATCGQANGSLELDADGGIDPYDYSIGGDYSSQTEYYDLPPGNYTVSVSDFNECIVSEEVIIGGGGGPTASAGPDKELTCSVTSVQLDGTGSDSGADISYVWTTVDGHFVSGDSTMTPTVDGIGTYVIEVFDAVNDCSSTDTTIVNNGGSLPVIAIADADVITCTVSSSTLDASASDNGADYTYLWSTTDGNIISGANSLIAQVDEAGTYQFTLTNTSNGCTSTKTIQVLSDVEAPIYSTQNDTLTCIQTTANICVNVTSNYDSIVWDASGLNSQCMVSTVPGDFGFTIYGSNGCTNNGIAKVVDKTNGPNIVIATPGTLGCSINSVDLDASASDNGESYIFSWSTQNGNFTSAPDSTIVNVDKAGIYFLNVFNNNTGCSSTDTVEVFGGATLANAGFTYDTDYNTVYLYGQFTQGAESTWATENSSAIGDTVSFSFNDNGDYNICHFMENSCGVDTSCSTISITEILPLDYTVALSNVNCFGGNDGAITITPSGGVGSYSASWTDSNGNTYSGLDLSGLSVGDYTMVLSDEGNHSVTKVVSITEPSKLEVGSNVIFTTENESTGSIELNVHGGTPPYRYSWSNGSVTKDISGLAAGSYTVEISDANGCTHSETYTVFITSTIDPDFITNFELYPNPVMDNAIVSLKFDENIEGSLKLVDLTGKLIKTFNISGNARIINLDMKYMSSGVYLLKLEAKNQVGVRKLIKL